MTRTTNQQISEGGAPRRRGVWEGNFGKSSPLDEGEQSDEEKEWGGVRQAALFRSG